MNVDGPKAPVISIGAASVAVLLSMIALVVVATRSTKSSERGIVPFETTVSATDVVKLRPDAVEVAKDDGAVIGMRVTDEKLREALGIRAADVVTAIAGRPLKREQDVAAAIEGASFIDPTALYVDIVRDGEPVVVRWKLDDNLRAAHRIDSTSRPPGAGVTSGNPFDPLAGDPAIDAIKKLDDFHYEVPRTTVDHILTDPMAYAKGARVVPAMSIGRTEGFKLYAIRPNSLYAKLGLSNGDLIRSVNGFELTAPDKALEIYMKLKDATSLEIELTRRGRDETLKIDIR